jgi:ribosome-associated translation inhibitor RaiA
MMDLDIQTEHVAMRPEWHRIIDAWVERCARVHPQVRGLDFTLRRRDQSAPGEVDVVVSTRGRHLRAGAHAVLMSEALGEALDALDRELLVREAMERRVS